MMYSYKNEQGILANFAIPTDNYNLIKLTIGHINDTYKVEGKRCFILQKINTTIFQNPHGLMENIERIGKHLQQSEYPYDLLSIVKTKSGALFFSDEKMGCWRVFDFIENSYSIDEVADEKQAFQGGEIFGTLLNCLIDLNPIEIVETIPDFHNWKMRWNAFEIALETDFAQKKRLISEFIQEVRKHEKWLKITLEKIVKDRLPTRITHNDTKINNILFDRKTGAAKAVIDWDTIMPSTLIADYGDMLRTFASSANEEEKDRSKVNFDFEKFSHFTDGFLSKMKRKITEAEQNHLINGGLILTYIQTIRFLTDYLNGDTYYQTHYSGQNLVRAKNQMHLFKHLFQNRKIMEEYVRLQVLYINK